jgi:orotate phosphoribosyltransferase
MTRTQKQWIEEYEKMRALWIYGGNPSHRHVKLPSERHSGVFFDSQLVTNDEVLFCDAACNLMKLLSNSGEVEGFNLVIVGPQTGATTKLAELLSEAIYPYLRRVCPWASPTIDGEKSVVFTKDELRILPGEHVLLCKDVLITGESVDFLDLTEKAVTEAGGIVLPLVLTLMNGSGLEEINGKKIIALINHPMSTWEAHECPLCKDGSEVIRPEGEENWALLNQKN